MATRHEELAAKARADADGDGVRKQPQYHVGVLGSGGVGKSALTIRMVTNDFISVYAPTLESKYLVNVEVSPGQEVPVEIVDTAGQDEYLSMLDVWIRECDGFLLVYSITDRRSLEAVQSIKRKIERIKEGQDVPIVLAGNKCDLEGDRQVQLEEVDAIVQEWKCPFFETSAMASINIATVFQELVKLLAGVSATANAADPDDVEACCQCVVS